MCGCCQYKPGVDAVTDEVITIRWDETNDHLKVT
jgi:hypothetical protein